MMLEILRSMPAHDLSQQNNTHSNNDENDEAPTNSFKEGMKKFVKMQQDNVMKSIFESFRITFSTHKKHRHSCEGRNLVDTCKLRELCKFRQMR